MKVAEFSNQTHKIISLNEMDIPTLVKYGHSVITFRDEHYIVLDNGNLYDQEKKREIPVFKVFRYIRAVKNSYGVIIAKRSNTRSSLNHVKYVRK
ncbi:hypothetical protein ACQKNO_24495 [Bacillus paramycoides]|uniref:hypothetical protein n=1 Tax=Bacillus paramycoides TaxID=2026194 RepID=UPI003CFF2E76